MGHREAHDRTFAGPPKCNNYSKFLRGAESSMNPLRTDQEQEMRHRASMPVPPQRITSVGGFDTGQLGAVPHCEIVPRARLSGKNRESTIHRRGERRTRIRMARKRISIGSSAKTSRLFRRIRVYSNSANQKPEFYSAKKARVVHCPWRSSSCLQRRGSWKLTLSSWISPIMVSATSKI